MKDIHHLEQLSLDQPEILAFAGGGNRCWWQAGAISSLLEQGWRLPRLLVGTSAGAAVAASFLINGTEAALASCLRLYSTNERIFRWRDLARLKLHFAHQRIYPAWLESFLNTDSFNSLLGSSTRLRVAVTRPSRLLGLTGSIVAGTLAYLVDKHLWNNIHPRLPYLFGLRQEFIDLDSCSSVEEARTLLTAAAAAPPIMSSVRIGHAAAIDGGYTDNVPIPPQSATEKSRTLVLLSRHYPQLPVLFRWYGRTYWQPSVPVPVSTWDCTTRTTVHDAFALGKKDTMQMLKRNILVGV